MTSWTTNSTVTTVSGGIVMSPFVAQAVPTDAFNHWGLIVQVVAGSVFIGSIVLGVLKAREWLGDQISKAVHKGIAPVASDFRHHVDDERLWQGRIENSLNGLGVRVERVNIRLARMEGRHEAEVGTSSTSPEEV